MMQLKMVPLIFGTFMQKWLCFVEWGKTAIQWRNVRKQVLKLNFSGSNYVISFRKMEFHKAFLGGWARREKKNEQIYKEMSLP